jgi:hypothetical protein
MIKRLPPKLLVKLAVWELRERAKYNRKRFILFMLGIFLGTGLGYSVAMVKITGDFWWYPFKNYCTNCSSVNG